MNETEIEKLKDLAVDGLDHVRAFLASKETTLGVGFQRAKLALAVLSIYGRMRATDTNRAAILLAASNAGMHPERIGLPAPRPALPTAKGAR